MNSSHRRQSRKILTIIRWVVFLPIFVLGFSWWFLAAPLSYGYATDVRLPVGDWEGIAVDDTGRIYLGDQSYSRIDVFSHTGEYLTRMDIPSRPFIFYIDSDNILRVRGSRTMFMFSLEGQLLKEVRLTGEQSRKFRDLQYPYDSAADTEGNVYTIAPYQTICARVTKTLPTGELQTIISEPRNLWILGVCDRTWLIGMFGMVGFIWPVAIKELRGKLRTWREKRQVAGPTN